MFVLGLLRDDAKTDDVIALLPKELADALKGSLLDSSRLVVEREIGKGTKDSDMKGIT